ncbi:MAG TPA: hypothetical protein PLI45_00020 [Candidatus Woesebacteria bacterium]|nr:hypothetical protein [Candidatus Woesebacteria bacterium]
MKPKRNTIFQRLVNRLLSKRVSFETPNITITRDDTCFRVLDSLHRQGLYFIDIDTKKYIDGLIDLPSIGLSFSPPTPIDDENESDLGFLATQKKESITKDDGTGLKVDAVLFFVYDGPECRTGYISKEGCYVYFLKIWNDLELKHWEEIIAKVVDDLTIKIEDYEHALVRFCISTTFVPNDTTKESQLIIPYSDKNSKTYAVSNDSISPRR